MFNEQVVREIAVFTQELRESVCRSRILSFVIIVHNIRCLSTFPGRHSLYFSCTQTSLRMVLFQLVWSKLGKSWFSRNSARGANHVVQKGAVFLAACRYSWRCIFPPSLGIGGKFDLRGLENPVNVCDDCGVKTLPAYDDDPARLEQFGAGFDSEYHSVRNPGAFQTHLSDVVHRAI